MDRQSEGRIAAGLQTGDPGAWLELYDAYAVRLWHHLARLSGTRSTDVGELVQATLLAAAESARTFDPSRGTLWLWLCGIARNQLALSHRRRLPTVQLDAGSGDPDPGRQAGEDSWGPWLSGTSDEPPCQIESRELATLVRKGLAQLPPEYQTLLLARYVDGVNAEQIAQDTGSTGQAIRSKLARARRALYDELSRLAPSIVAEDGEPR